MCRTLLLLLLFLVGFAWISILLIFFLGYRIKVRPSYIVCELQVSSKNRYNLVTYLMI